MEHDEEKNTILESLLDTTSTILSPNLYKSFVDYEDVFVGKHKINSVIESVKITCDKRLDDNTIICLDYEKKTVAIIKTGYAGYIMPVTDADENLRSYTSQFEASVGIVLEQ